MADHTTVALVREILPKGLKVDNATADPPTEATVRLSLIPQISARLELAAVEGGASLPIDPAQNLGKWLKYLATHEVAYQVIVQRANSQGTKYDPETDKWHEEYLAALEKLEEDAAVMAAQDSSLPWSYTADADASDPTDPKNPTFTKDYVE
jgi:hypothetical protein